MPETIPVIITGATELLRLDALCGEFNLTTRQAKGFLKALHIPLVYVGPSAFFSPSQLDRALYLRSRIGQPSFAAPGSDHKTKYANSQKGTTTTIPNIAWTPELEKEYQSACKEKGKVAGDLIRRIVGQSACHLTDKDHPVHDDIASWDELTGSPEAERDASPDAEGDSDLHGEVSPETGGPSPLVQ